MSAHTFVTLLGTVLLGVTVLSPVTAAEVQTVGDVEHVVLLPWGARLPARIDTGAAMSSLDARDLKIEGNVAHFKLPEAYGGQDIRLPVIGWRTIKSAESSERRPVVRLEICLGSKRLHARVNLNDRSGVKYPMIIGRNVLKTGYVVDCFKSFCAPPSCPEVSPR